MKYTAPPTASVPHGTRADGPWDIVDEGANELKEEFLYVDTLVCRNMRRVREAFAVAGLKQRDLQGAAGSGSSQAWHALDCAIAHIMGTDSALVSLSLLSGAPSLLQV
jgi:cystathionine beta-lyase family protein involved in aluminum resistance